MDLSTARRLARKRQRGTHTSDRDSFQLGGGQNLVDSTLLIKPGQLLADDNYEMGVAGGYERIGGYERFDGQRAPSAEPYYILVFRNKVPFTTYMQPGLHVTDSNPAQGDAAVLSAPVQIVPPSRNCCAGTEDLLNDLPNSWTAQQGMIGERTDLDAIPPPDFGVILRGVQGGVFGSDMGYAQPRRLYELVETAVTAAHLARKAGLLNGVGVPSLPIGNRLLVSMFFKRRSSSDRRYVRFGTDQPAYVGGANPTAILDLATGTVSDLSASVSTAYATSFGEGWWRFTVVTKNSNADQTGNAIAAVAEVLDDTKTVSHLGDVTKGIFLSGLNADTAAGADPVLGAYSHAIATGVLPLPAGIAYVAIRAPVNIFTSLVTGGTQGTLLDSNGTDVGMWVGGIEEAAAPTFELHRQYRKLAANVVRALIQKVPGDGPIRGVWFYNGKVLAYRDDTVAGRCRMWRSGSFATWSEVTFAKHLAFSAGLAAGQALVVEGATITGNTSGATGTLKRLNLTKNDWSSNVAAGQLIFATITGTFSNGEVLKVGGTNVATCVGTQTTPTWALGGRFRFRTYNFYGASDKKRMYGVNGLNTAFEYDDLDGILASIKTGMVVDIPNRVGTHREMLFLAFLGGSIQNSAVGLPANWTVVLGANEITIGDDVSDFLEEVGDSLFIFGRGTTFQLLGSSSSNFQLDRFDPNNGALDHTVQRIGFGIHLDDRGFASLETTDKWGNYEANTFSGIVHPMVERKLTDLTATESLIYRRRNRYRCFFDDGTFVSIGIKGPQGRGFVNLVTSRVTGITNCNLGKVVRCACSEEDLDGTERLFFGSDDGYIYEMEKGTSFDGDPVIASARLPFHHSGRPDHEKTYRSGHIEGLFPGGATLKVTVSLSKGEVELDELDISASIGGALYDYDMNWEAFTWDGPVQDSKTFAIDADGKNISLLIRHESDVELPHTLRAVVYQTSMRTLARETHVG